MKKHYRFTPEFIIQKIKTLKASDIIVATSIEYSRSQIREGALSHIGVKSVNSHLEYQKQIIPSSDNGRYSLRNRVGWEVVRTDLPKIRKTVDLGERPIYGDWDKGSFILQQDRDVYQRDFYPPKQLSITIEIINEFDRNNERYFNIKFAVDQILNTKSKDFNDDLFFCVNLLQENIEKVDIFSTSASHSEYLKSLDVAWEILPIGERDEVISRILSSYKNIPGNLKLQIIDRRDFLESLKPINYVYGFSGINRYFGALFSDDLVVFENLDYGNAIYIMFESWKQLSQLSRIDLLKLPSDKFIRIIHTGDWKGKVSRVVQNEITKKKGGTDDTGPRIR